MSLILSILKGAGLLIAGALALVILLGGVESLRRLGDSAPYDRTEVAPGRALHSYCTGPADGPSVLYDAGMFGIYADGWWIAEALSETHRVCLYDRAGLGWSDPLPDGAIPTPGFHIEDMRRLAAARGLRSPFVLVGHSAAGVRLHAFVNRYPGEVAGLVFLDAAAPQIIDTDRFSRFIALARTVGAVTTFSARVGFAAGVSRLLPDVLDLPAEAAADKRRSIAAVRHHKGTFREGEGFLAADFDLLLAERAGTVPVAVIDAGEGPSRNARFAEAARAATGVGEVRRLPDASHVSILDRENAALTAALVRHMTTPPEETP